MIMQNTARTFVSVILLLAVTVWGKPTCRNRFHTEIVCVAGNNDYILKRGLVSDDNKTVTITLKDCRITDVDLEAFQNVFNLEEIDLSRNQISNLKVGVFGNTLKLLSLRLSRNLLTTLPLGIFDNLLKLQRLDLSDNMINHLPLGIFDNLLNLIRLELSENALLGKDLNPFLFNQNPKIKYLHFSGNNMSEAPEELLNAMRELSILGLNNCSLTEVPKFATRSNMRTLKRLKLKVNIITSINDAETFANLENLVSLDMTGNLIANLNGTVFRPLSRLRIIDLPFNKIKQIPNKLFHNMISLRSVDLSNNLIEIVPVNIFRGTHLDDLDLSGNRISFLEINFCSKLSCCMKRLSTFYFKDNPFQCACLLEIVNEVKKYGIKYDSDVYKEENAGCSTANERCMRPVEDEYGVSNEEDTLWTMFGHPHYTNASNE